MHDTQSMKRSFKIHDAVCSMSLGLVDGAQEHLPSESQSSPRNSSGVRGEIKGLKNIRLSETENL